jgi:hypothetical protein
MMFCACLKLKKIEVMKKKILVLAAMAAMGLTVIADHTTPTDPGGQEGSTECTQCKVSDASGNMLFGCKTSQDAGNCSVTLPSGGSFSCANAKICSR